jgi:prepilin-type N-terminal cleavage/methylation domain-containing protein
MRIKNAFTLVELLLVVGIIVVLVGAIITVVNPVALQQRSRDSRRKADLEAIRQALELYRADSPTKIYPGGTSLLVHGGYLSVLPVEPDDGLNYSYSPGGGNATYTLCTVFEIDTGDPCVYNP